MSLADIRIVGPGSDKIFTLFLVHPDDLDTAEEVETAASTLAEAWGLLITEAKASYSGYLRVRGIADGFGRELLDFGREGRSLASCDPATWRN